VAATVAVVADDGMAAAAADTVADADSNSESL